MRVLSAALAGLLALPALSRPADEEKVPQSTAPAAEREGLERGEWKAEGFGNPAEARVVRPEGHEENRLLRVAYGDGKSDKAALKRHTGLSAGETGSLRVHVYTAEASPPVVALALCTGEDFVWQETEPVKLKTGWNALAFDLAEKKWKSASSQWKNEAALVDRGDVRAIEFLVFNGAASGVLYVDALRIDRDGNSAGIQALVKNLGADEFAAREEAEKALLEVGRRAVESLREAAESPEPEVAQRAQRVLDRILGRGARRASPEGQEPRLRGRRGE